MSIGTKGRTGVAAAGNRRAFPSRFFAAFGCFVFLTLAPELANGADNSDAFEKEKNPPEVGLITRMRRQEESRQKQSEYDVKIAIPDVDAAERELEGLNNAVSNALKIAEQTRRTEEANSKGFFQSIVIAAALLGAGILVFRLMGPRIGFLSKVPEEEPGTSSASEEKSFADFVATFKVGPKRPSNYSSAIANDSKDDPITTSETRGPSPLKLFFDGAPKSIAVLRSLIQEITRVSADGPRHKLLVDLSEKIHGLKGMAGHSEVLPVWQLAAALEGLVKQLSEKNRNVTPSTLRTVASAVDLLEALSVPGVRTDLMSNPPIRLLAVDDDALSRHAVSFALKKALNKPDLAENGEAAMALVSHIKYDAIFLDVQMPGMDGFETCKKIHGTELNRAAPVVFVTCHSDFDARAKSTLSGGIDLIGKPFLTFEITVKALTLVFRERLNTANDLVAKPATEPGSQAVELSAGVVAKAFLTHAPEHVRTLRTRLEQVGAAKEEAKQEHLVDLYLAVHSLRAEAELAKFQPVVQLSSAVEVQLKKIIEDPKNSSASNLKMIGDALDLLGEIFALKTGADLASESAMQILLTGNDLETLMLAIRTRLKPEKEEVPAPLGESSPAEELVAAGK
jgi:DNA-binding response OmpR family regulator